jgi:hypothetical protein
LVSHIANPVLALLTNVGHPDIQKHLLHDVLQQNSPAVRASSSLLMVPTRRPIGNAVYRSKETRFLQRRPDGKDPVGNYRFPTCPDIAARELEVSLKLQDEES